MEINFTVNQSTLEHLKFHLYECSNNFVPKLDSYVDIESYAEKLISKALRFEAFFQEKLIGLIAIYYSVEEKKSYISNVSVIPYFNGKGIASELFSKSLFFLREEKVEFIQLEVDLKNLKAIALYKKIGFVKEIEKENKLLMKLNLKQ